MKTKLQSQHIAILVISVLFIALSFGIEPLSELTVTSDAAYPLLVGGLSLLFALLIIVEDMKKRPARRTGGEDPEEGEDSGNEKVFAKDVFIVMGLMILYGVLLYLLGYILSTLVFSILTITFLEDGRWKSGLLIGFICTFIVVLVFKYGFSVILP